MPFAMRRGPRRELVFILFHLKRNWHCPCPLTVVSVALSPLPSSQHSPKVRPFFSLSFALFFRVFYSIPFSSYAFTTAAAALTHVPHRAPTYCWIVRFYIFFSFCWISPSRLCQIDDNIFVFSALKWKCSFGKFAVIWIIWRSRRLFIRWRYCHAVGSASASFPFFSVLAARQENRNGLRWRAFDIFSLRTALYRSFPNFSHIVGSAIRRRLCQRHNSE